MLVSVVIVSLNGESRIGTCLEAVARTDWPELEVVVVDNGSTDDTAAVVREGFPWVRLVESPRNLGFAGGNCLGVAHARGGWIVLLNDDTRPEPGWVRALMGAADGRARVGILGCLLLYPDGRTIQHGGGVIHPNALTDHLGWGQESKGTARGLRRCDYVTGAAMAIRRAVWEEVGPLDPGYFPIYFEESDLCWRARRAGWEVAVVPAARVIHDESQTQGVWSWRFLVRYHRHRLRFMLRNWRGSRLLNALKSEAGWLARHRPYDQLVPLALAYAQTLLGLIARP